MHNHYAHRQGFTIVELLIVIVVIAILAAISIVAFTGIQERARDSQRVSDIRQYQKALAQAMAIDGAVPGGFAYVGSTGTGAASFISAIVDTGYLPDLLRDPIYSGGSGYVYVNQATTHSWVLGDDDPNTYVIRYRLERRPTDTGSYYFCATSKGIVQAGTQPGTNTNQCAQE